MVELYDIFKQEIANLPSGASAVWVPNPIAASVATLGKQRGGNLVGLQEVPQQCAPTAPVSYLLSVLTSSL